MLLVDASVWIDHLHLTEPRLVTALERVDVHQHPMVVGELALGTLGDRTRFLRLLSRLPVPRIASHGEVLHLVDERHLYGRGLALVDAHLLASTLLTPGLRLWTRDRRLKAAAAVIGVPYLDD